MNPEIQEAFSWARNTPYQSVAARYAKVLAIEVERLQGESKPSDIPCCKCEGPVVEFSVPNLAWNTIVRDNGPETDQEYLCLDCLARIAAKKIGRLQAIVELAREIGRVEMPVDRLQDKLSLACLDLTLHITAYDRAAQGKV